eukprot:GFUD01007482.1.p1 GENE.GFUD01007482.1~~GFUD01007482.1.p1  ORF type:complete len:398 (-),score=111.78 GFUD01007482.1:31-1224(-)
MGSNILAKNMCSYQKPPENYSCQVPYFSVSDINPNIKMFDEIIDVRTPDEFAEDRVFNAINLPVLDNQQRIEVGTLYKKEKSIARKLGAALINKNTSELIVNHFMTKDLTYKPLIYCWRGGHRSKSLAIILKEIGFQPAILSGGYKEYRKHVRDSVQDETKDENRTKFDDCKIILVSGSTGSGKSLLLETLEKRGEQILHLEQLAKHKGSVLGNYPNEPQPGQKLFETEIYHKIEFEFDPKKVIWVENESTRVGNLAVPMRVWKKMLGSPRVHINVSMEDRIKFILKDYDYICTEESKPGLIAILTKLERHAGKKKSAEWCEMVRESKYEELVGDLIVEYYDKTYQKPRGTAIDTFDVPQGLILDPEQLLTSPMLNDIISIGENYLEPQSEKVVDLV